MDMKKYFLTLLAIIVMAGVSIVASSCIKDNDNIDYYSFNMGFHENQNCNFSAIDPVYDKYKDWRAECRLVSLKKAKAKWAEAEAEFKAVESSLTADKDCYIEIHMDRYTPVKGVFTPVENVGHWRFPAAN